ncbi:MAG: phenyltransferase domain-containing protein [Deltaproteobacteria bacterium]|nr:phenyltransferase domain-containing protein [Deltaproteobacteria bacterium]
MHVTTAVQKSTVPVIDVDHIAHYILRVQRHSGEIPWSEDGKTDPWDHVESAMGLTVAGYFEAAKKAYNWSRNTQLDDGSWWSEYTAGKPVADAFKDANMTAYIAVGVHHYYLATGDIHFLHRMWPAVSRAMDFVMGLQGPGGQIFWAKRADHSISKRALLTGSSSIYLSLCCALESARVLGLKMPAWEMALAGLGEAIRNRPHLFDRSKSRFSMDWYYPILSGAVTGKAARSRVENHWEKFVVDSWGVLCVSGEPWVTMAETCELVMSLAAMGEYALAETIFQWICGNCYEDGAYWTGLTIPERIIYTDEKTTWTGAAVLLAADMLYSLTPACELFRIFHSRKPGRLTGGQPETQVNDIHP